MLNRSSPRLGRGAVEFSTPICYYLSEVIAVPKYSHPTLRKGLTQYTDEHDTLGWFSTSTLDEEFEPYRTIDVQLDPAVEWNGTTFRFVAVISTRAQARYQFLQDWIYWHCFVQDHDWTPPPCPLRNSDLGLTVPGDWESSVFDHSDEYLSSALRHHFEELTGNSITVERTETPDNPQVLPEEVEDIKRDEIAVENNGTATDDSVETDPVRDRSGHSNAELIRDLRLADLYRQYFGTIDEWRPEDVKRVRSLVQESRYEQTLKEL